jgi:hypothetical protein
MKASSVGLNAKIYLCAALCFSIGAGSMLGQAGSTDASVDYLSSLQRSMTKHPVNTPEQRARLCTELQEIFSEMKADERLKSEGEAGSFSCEKSLAETESSPYERADFVFLRMNVEPRIKSAITSLGEIVPSEPVIGTLPITILNAKALQPEGGIRPVIVLNDGVFLLPYDILRAAILSLQFSQASNGLTMTPSNPGEIASHLAEHPELVHSFEWAVLRYLHLESGSPTDGSLEVKTDLGFVKNTLFLEGLTEAMETFILSHEYAHLILHHDLGSGAGLALAPAGGPSIKVRERSYSWRQEFEADAYGFLILDEVLKTAGNKSAGSYLKDPLYPFYLSAPRLLFTMMARVENAKSFVDSGAASPGPTREDIRIAKEAVSNMFSKTASKGRNANVEHIASHPPFLFRAKEAELIESKARSAFFEKADLPSDTRSAWRISEAIDVTVGVMFDATLPEFERRHTSSKEPINGKQ